MDLQHIWHDTQYTPSYLGVIFGNQQRTITLTHNIINPFISTKLIILRAYGTLQRKSLYDDKIFQKRKWQEPDILIIKTDY